MTQRSSLSSTALATGWEKGPGMRAQLASLSAQLSQLQQQMADMQAIISRGFSGTVTISGTTLTYVNGICTST